MTNNLYNLHSVSPDVNSLRFYSSDIYMKLE